MPVSWRDDSETFRAFVVKVILDQVTSSPEKFKASTKPTLETNSKSRKKVKKTLVDVLDWARLVSSLPDGATLPETREMWRRCFDAGKLIKGGWTRTEDTLLDELVKTFGTKHWAKFCAYIPGRNGKQCRERWLNHLNPNLKKGPWDQHELDTLVRDEANAVMLPALACRANPIITSLACLLCIGVPAVSQSCVSGRRAFPCPSSHRPVPRPVCVALQSRPVAALVAHVARGVQHNGTRGGWRARTPTRTHARRHARTHSRLPPMHKTDDSCS